MPGLRTRSAGAKVTEEEYREMEKRAETRGLTVGEWCREVLLTEVERAEAPSTETVLAEVLALRMILLNMMAHIGQGRELSTEQMQKLIDRADAERFRRVTERVQEQAARKKPAQGKSHRNGNQ